MNGPLASSNGRVQRLRRLVQSRELRRTEGVVVVEGAVLLREASNAGWEVESQFVAPGGEPLDVGGDVFRVASGVLEKVASTESPQPLIGIVRRRIAGVDLLATCDFVVVADRVSDPGNLGTMLRSAAAAGADALVVTRGTVDHTSPKVVRASAGCVFRLPVVELGELGDLVATHLVVIGTSSHAAPCYTDVDLTRRVALVFGSEPRGLESDSRVDEWLRIPLSDDVESLNVAMACSILCFEVARQRRGPSSTLGES